MFCRYNPPLSPADLVYCSVVAAFRKAAEDSGQAGWYGEAQLKTFANMGLRLHDTLNIKPVLGPLWRSRCASCGGSAATESVATTASAAARTEHTSRVAAIGTATTTDGTGGTVATVSTTVSTLGSVDSGGGAEDENKATLLSEQQHAMELDDLIVPSTTSETMATSPTTPPDSAGSTCATLLFFGVNVGSIVAVVVGTTLG